MNKITILFHLFYLVSLNVFSQTKRATSNVWLSRHRLFSSEVWINSDSTYFLLDFSCTITSVSKGIWSCKKDTFKFSESMNYELTPKVSFTRNEILKLTFLDCYNMPIDYLSLRFEGDSSKVFQTSPNSDGSLILPSNSYKDMYIDGLQEININNASVDRSNIVHLSINETGHYIFRFNYPKFIVVNDQKLDNFRISSESLYFRTRKNELIRIWDGTIFRKKY